MGGFGNLLFTVGKIGAVLRLVSGALDRVGAGAGGVGNAGNVDGCPPLLSNPPSNLPMVLRTQMVDAVPDPRTGRPPLADRARIIVGQANKSVLDPRTRQEAAAVLSQRRDGKWAIPERDYDGEVAAIFDHVRATMRYTGDIANLDTFQTAMRSRELGIGDCDCIAIRLAALLAVVGYETGFRVIRQHGSDEWDHIFVLVWVPVTAGERKLVGLDASVDRPAGWTPPEAAIAEYVDFWL